MEKRKKRRGDRNDAYLIRDNDGLHALMPHIMPYRTDNEAVLNEIVDLGEINKYIAERNKDNPDFKYTFFHIICAAIAKTIALRSKMNYFIEGKRYYEREDIILSFTMKRKFADDAGEALVRVIVDRDCETSPVEQVYSKIKETVTKVRSENAKNITDTMDSLAKKPRWVLSFITWFLRKRNFKGKYPKSLMAGDPAFSSAFISNLGSIKMNASYHHLSNWGTNSFFVVIGEKHLAPKFNEKGKCEMREVLDMGMTIDERIADGFYFAQSIKILRKLLQNPTMLDLPIMTPVEIE